MSCIILSRKLSLKSLFTHKLSVIFCNPFIYVNTGGYCKSSLIDLFIVLDYSNEDIRREGEAKLGFHLNINYVVSF